MTDIKFDFDKMIAGLSSYVNAVQKYIADLTSKGASGGTVDIGTMFSLQFKMQIMSQYIEAMSNVLSATHQEMISMARATKGG